MSKQDPLLGQKLGDYTILSILGRGGMARVYKGIDNDLQRYAAVKVIDAMLLIGTFATEYQARFRREAMAIAHLSHPNIVNIYQYGNRDDIYYMAMRFIDGYDLGHLLRLYRRNGMRLPLEYVIKIGRDIASALDHAHAEGVVHRDIKPSNIMVTSSNQAILTDFGLALSVIEGSLGRTFGSAHYIAPEQAVASNNAVPQSDLYALAVVLFEMLTGKVPFDDPSELAIALQHIQNQPPLPSSLEKRLTSSVDQVFAKGLSKWIGERYDTGSALITDLENALRADGLLVGSLNDLPTLPLPIDNTPEPSSKLLVSETVVLPSAPLSAQQPTPIPASFIPAPAAPSDTHPTPSTPKPPDTPDVKPSSVRRNAIPLAIAAAAILSLAILALAAQGQRSATPPTATIAALVVSPTPTVRPSQTVALAAQPTTRPPVARTPTRTPTRRPTATPTPTPSYTATRRPTITPSPSSTVTPTPSPTLTRTPSPSPTATSTPTITTTPTIPFMGIMPTASVSAPAAPNVSMTYTNQVFTLTNISDDTLDLSNLTFEQITRDGNVRQFESDLWTFGNFNIQRLASGSCVQLWSASFTDIDLRGTCLRRSGFSVSTEAWFWQQTTGSAVFVVRSGARVLASCLITAGECEFSLEQPLDDA